ncbi:TPA: hypothetical protein HA270_04195 [Candidatus Woesearchaeota archaeon]|nr:hypothetical protein [Candidatus Woesearchaeota archaeon]
MPIGIATITVVLFMFHMRVFDDMKDKRFDDRHHPSRLIQKGKISLKALLVIDLLGIAVQFILTLLYSVNAVIWLLFAYAYAALAGADFMAGTVLRRHFFLYNLLNILQLFFVQLYIYAMFTPFFSLTDPGLFIHFLFAIGNAGILEIARKLKAPEQESTGNDTYSARLGIDGAAVFFVTLCLFIYGLFLALFFSQPYTTSQFLLSFAAPAVVCIAAIAYALLRKGLSAAAIPGAAIFFYLVTHGSLALPFLFQ